MRSPSHHDGYHLTLRRIRDLIANGLPLSCSGSGETYTCSWGLCSVSHESWPYGTDAQRGSDSVLPRRGCQRCPLDTRSSGNVSRCYEHCTMVKRGRCSVEKALRAYDKRIKGE